LRVAFAGTSEFALPALAALRAHDELVGVLTQPDRKSGRGQHLGATPVKRAALAERLPIAQPQTLRSDAARVTLAAWKPEVLVVVAYGLLLPPEVLALPRLGCINVHASLLPRWRGAAPIQRALLAGDTETGVTIMQMESGLDTGAVLLQRRFPIRHSDTGGSLCDELAALGASALIEALEGLAGGVLRPTPQPTQGITYAAKIDKAEARIDWSGDAAAIERQVRAFNPWPVAETRLEGEQLRIFAARVVPPEESELASVRNVSLKDRKCADPGTIMSVDRESVIVQCGHGCLALTAVQRPGRRAVGAGDYARALALVGRRLG
jgi:methionyl-tRNA formyltransferase